MRPLGTVPAPTPVSGVAPPGTPPDLDNIPVSSPFTAAPRGGAGGPGTVGTVGGADRSGGAQGTQDIPVVTGIPVSRPTAQPSFDPASQPSGQQPFDVFGPRDASGSDGGAAPAGYTGYSGSSYAAGTTTGYGNDADASGTYGVGHPGGDRNGDGGTFGGAGNGGGGDSKGLPRRVRQANLAPQLRSSRGSNEAGAAGGKSGVPQAAAPNPADMRNTLSAMQRGWQQGRAQQKRDTEGNNDS